MLLFQFITAICEADVCSNLTLAKLSLKTKPKFNRIKRYQAISFIDSIVSQWRSKI